MQPSRITFCDLVVRKLLVQGHVAHHASDLTKERGGKCCLDFETE